MRVAESRWIAQQFVALPHPQRRVVLNVGSSTAAFRTRNQPHIDGNIFGPLVGQGTKVVHADLKAAPGVDVAGDLADASVRQSLRGLAPNVVLCSNLLEHVANPTAFAAYLRELVPPGGYLIVTVPRDYPYHADPIDNGFRPNPDELASMFSGMERVVGQVVADTTYIQELRGGGLRGLKKAARAIAGTVLSRGDIGKARRDRLRYLAKPFTTTCVVLRATA